MSDGMKNRVWRKAMYKTSLHPTQTIFTVCPAKLRSANRGRLKEQGANGHLLIASDNMMSGKFFKCLYKIKLRQNVFSVGSSVQASIPLPAL